MPKRGKLKQNFDTIETNWHISLLFTNDSTYVGSRTQKFAKEIKNKVCENISGTSAFEVVVKFDCSEKFLCKKVTL